MFVSYLFTLLLTTQLTTMADEAEAPFDLILEEQNPIRLVFNDGRIAELRASVQSAEIVTQSKIEESTCYENYDRPECEIKFPLTHIRFRFVWVKNPEEPNRVGEFVKSIQRNDFLEIGQTYGYKESKKYPKLNEFLPDPQITCSNYYWYQGEKHAPSISSILDWGVENNVVNSETSINENRVFLSAINVNLINKDNRLVINNIDNIVAPVFSEYIFYGDIVGWTYFNNENNLCQTSMKINKSEIIDQASANLDLSASDKSRYKTILYNKNSDFISYILDQNKSIGSTSFRELLGQLNTKQNILYSFSAISVYEYTKGNITGSKIEFKELE